jgi:Zn-dependent peptidase ImmA (M78 family)
MAKKDEKNLNLLPEEKIARRLSIKYSLSPPIDIPNLVNRFADIECVELPTSADAVTIGIKSKRPKIFLNSIYPPIRQKFTLAHELGHILIPWHVGNIISHTDLISLNISHYDLLESEANKFASELLVPANWLIERFFKSNSLEELFSTLTTAGISNVFLSIALIQRLPPGYCFIETDRLQKVLRFNQSDGSKIPSPNISEKLITKSYSQYSFDSYILPTGKGKIFWWHYQQSIPESPKEKRDWRELLDAIVKDVNLPEEKIHHIKQSIGGIIGATNSPELEESFDAFLYRLKVRLTGRREILPLLSHRDFDSFLFKRAMEIYNRRKI